MAAALATLIGVPLLLAVLLLAGANTGPGRLGIAWLAGPLTGGRVRLLGLTGRFPDALRARQVTVADADGVYLTLDGIALDWSPSRLLHGLAVIDRFAVQRAGLARLPRTGGGSAGGGFSLPLPVSIGRLTVARLDLGAPVTGSALSLAADGSASFDAADRGQAELAMHRLGGDGTYRLTGRISADHAAATLIAQEAPDGPIAALLRLPALGAIAIDAAAEGPWDGLATHLSVAAGPLRATAAGSIDLTAGRAALTLTADAPAMAPRPGLAWQSVHLDATVAGPFRRPDAAGSLSILGLHAGGSAAGTVTADLAGNSGTMRLRARLAGVRLPGPQPDLLAADPLDLEATLHLDAPDRPVSFTLHHPLLALTGSAQTAGPRQVAASLDLPDLAPLAAAAGLVLQGHATLAIDATTAQGTTRAALHGGLGVTGGQGPLPALAGPAASLAAEAQIDGDKITLSRLLVDGRALSASASGGVTGGHVALDWVLRLTDLAALRPDLAGQFTAQGQASGTLDDLAVTAALSGDIAGQGYRSGAVTAQLDATGLPASPDVRLTASGTLFDAPLTVALEAVRQGDRVRATIQRADWKSLHAEGALSLLRPAVVPTGRLTVGVSRLADLAPLLGRPITGSLTASLDSDSQTAHFAAQMQGAGLPGTLSIGRASVEASVTDPAGANPVADGSATLDGLAIAGTTATLRLAAKGPLNALAVRLTADAVDLGHAPASLQAAAAIDAAGRTVAVTALRGDWKQQSLRLLGPVRIGFADGVVLAPLRLGLGAARLAVTGRAAPGLDLTVQVDGLPVGLAALADPAFAADGTITAAAHLTGSISHPAGSIRLVASGLRARDPVGSGLPPANLTATATLTGSAATLDATLLAGPSHLAVTGSVPFAASGALGLHAGGTIELAMLDPILAGAGRQVRGRLSLDGAIAGTRASPRLSGLARLSQGAVQDIVTGVHISDIAATVEAAGDALRLTSFTAKAGPGSIGASGTVGLGGGWPVDLHLTADSVRLPASDLLTATSDMDLTLSGALAGSLAVSGRVGVRRADIRIPERLPASVAVLPVRIAGAPPPPAAEPVPAIGLDVTLDAPQQVFVRGRGVDAELGGRIGIHGTLVRPLPDGALQLRRGSYSLVGRTLTFTEGTITFAGAGLTDPALRLVSTTTTAAMTATLTISGQARDPKITLSSVPEAPQDEILSQLLFDATTAKLTPFQAVAIAAALGSLSGLPSAVTDPLGGVRAALGLDRLSIGSGSTGDPTVEAGRYLARGVYVGARQSTSGGGSAVTVQVDLAKGLKLDATAGTGASAATGAAGSADASSVGLSWQFDY